MKDIPELLAYRVWQMFFKLIFSSEAILIKPVVILGAYLQSLTLSGTKPQ